MKTLLWLSPLVAFLLWSCSSNTTGDYLKISGYTQGTTYQIQYGPTTQNLAEEVEAFLKAFDESLSTYISHSLISRMNRNERIKMNDHVYSVIQRSFSWYEKSNGAFDITVGPLLKYYGFDNGAKIDNVAQDSILHFIGMDQLVISDDSVLTKSAAMQLDVNAIAQGYAVDLICEKLENQGIKNYLVEVGGEVKCMGKNAHGQKWRVGIDMPDGSSTTSNRALMRVVELDGYALATSGNYRKAREESGVKYTHTIDPRSGKMIQSNLLSASILSPTCMDADAAATACMVMGLNDAIKFVNEHSELEALFIYAQKDSLMVELTEGFNRILYLGEND